MDSINNMKQTPENSEQWLEFMETQLRKKGYEKYFQFYKKSSFQFWKTICIEGEQKYQVAVAFYDYEKYKDFFPKGANRYSISFELILLDIDFHVNLSVSNNMNIDSFEKICSEFYEKFKFKDLQNEKE